MTSNPASCAVFKSLAVFLLYMVVISCSVLITASWIISCKCFGIPSQVLRLMINVILDLKNVWLR